MKPARRMDPDRLNVYQYLIALSKGLRIDQHKWLAKQAQKHDLSPSDVLREVVDAYRQAQEDLVRTSNAKAAASGDGAASASHAAGKASSTSRLSLPNFPSVHDAGRTSGSPKGVSPHAPDTGRIQSFLEEYQARLEDVDGPEEHSAE